MTLALLLKISLPPILVALMSLAARRWGPTFGGLIMGLPWMTGPVLFFLGLDKGPEFLVSAARGAVLAVWGIGAFILAFGFAAKWVRWPGAIGAAIVAYLVSGVLIQGLDVPHGVAAAIATGAMLIAYRVLPTPQAVPAALKPPAWDIPARMTATFALVTGIMFTADLLGPQRSGLVASFPVILTVIGCFTHSQLGRDGLLRVLRGISLSLLAFVGFFTVVGYATPKVGQIAAYGAAAVVALIISGSLIAWSRRPLITAGASGTTSHVTR